MWTLYGLEQYLLTVLVVLFYACIVLCIMYMTIQPTRLPIHWFVLYCIVLYCNYPCRPQPMALPLANRRHLPWLKRAFLLCVAMFLCVWLTTVVRSAMTPLVKSTGSFLADVAQVRSSEWYIGPIVGPMNLVEFCFSLICDLPPQLFPAHFVPMFHDVSLDTIQ